MNWFSGRSVPLIIPGQCIFVCELTFRCVALSRSRRKLGLCLRSRCVLKALIVLMCAESAYSGIDSGEAATVLSSPCSSVLQLRRGTPRYTEERGHRGFRNNPGWRTRPSRWTDSQHNIWWRTFHPPRRTDTRWEGIGANMHVLDKITAGNSVALIINPSRGQIGIPALQQLKPVHRLV